MTNHCKLTATNMESEHKYYNHMKKCCFIIPYFGHFNNYFQLFLKSCSYNEDFNWLIITDDKTKYNYPKNVKVIYQSFEETVSFVQSKFDCPCNIVRPYKFCDLKPMYGYIFEDYIKDFEFWGYCDCDIILGKLSDFITDEILSSYDKLFCLGHMTLIKNSKENNRLFMTNKYEVPFYKHVLSMNDVYAFDEVSGKKHKYDINQIFKEANKKIYEEDLSFNVNIRYPYFIRVKYCGYNGSIGIFKNERYIKSIYVWENGYLYRIFKDALGKCQREDFLYIHLQRRKMEGANKCYKSNAFQIAANKFRPLIYDQINELNFNKIQKVFMCTQYINIVIKPKFKKIIKHLFKIK